MGPRLIRRWLLQPLTDVAAINRRLDVVEALIEDGDRRDLLRADGLAPVPDLDALSRRLEKYGKSGDGKEKGKGKGSSGKGRARNASAGLRDIYAVYRFAKELPLLISTICGDGDNADDDDDDDQSMGDGEVADILRARFVDDRKKKEKAGESETGDGEGREYGLRSVASSLSGFVALAEEVLDLDELGKSGALLVNAKFDADLARMARERNQCRAEMEEMLAEARETWGSSFKSAKKSADGSDLKLEHDKNHGFVFRVTAKHKSKARNLKRPAVQVKKLLTSCLLFSTSALRPLSENFETLSEEYEERQATLVAKAVDVARTYTPLLRAASRIVAEVDAFASFAHAAAHASGGPYVRPEIIPWEGESCEESGSARLVFTRCRHPCMESSDVATNGGAFIANDYALYHSSSSSSSSSSSAPASSSSSSPSSTGSRFQVITGPNMGGKSTYIRQLGVCVVMAQAGSFVPADAATVAPVDAVLARVGAGDAQMQGVSTFMAEMLEASAIIRTATSRSLVLIDELGRGTSTYDGFGLAWAISEYLARDVQCFCLFATHFHELTALAPASSSSSSSSSTTATTTTTTTTTTAAASGVPGVVNRHAAAHAGDGAITMLYEIREGACDRSFGIHVAELASFPASVLDAARKKAAELETFDAEAKKRAEERASAKRKRGEDAGSSSSSSEKGREEGKENGEGDGLSSEEFLDAFASLPLDALPREEVFERARGLVKRMRVMAPVGAMN